MYFFNSKLVVWHNPNKNIYYYKIIKRHQFNYVVGYKNRFGHVIVLVIENIGFKVYKVSLKKRVLNNLICFLQNILRKM